MISSCSASMSMRVRSGGKGNPCARCSASFQPVPMPSSTRPPEMWSAVTALRASTEGWRNVAGETSVPSRSRDVIAASADSVAHASSEPRPPTPSTDP